MTDPRLTMTAADLGRAIGAQEIDPRDLAQAFLDAIASHPLAERIYARTTPDRAMQEAEAAAKRAAAGRRLSALDGVPASWKDLFDTAGVATEAGSKLLAGRMPDRDAVVLANATAKGLVCLGKTHMAELAFSGLGYNPMTATSPSVIDPDAVAGGSSSGAAASVAFGLAPLGVGSDTGGSVRIPSVWNDLVGLKTTSGRLSLEGVVPLAPSFDTVGPLCRSVEDAAEMFSILGGGVTPDLGQAKVDGAQLMVLENVLGDDVEDRPAAGFFSAVERLQAAGATVERQTLPLVDRASELSAILFASEAYGTWADVIEAAPNLMYSEILDRFRSGGTFKAADYVAAWQELHVLRRQWSATVAGYDAVILPTTPLMPPKISSLQDSETYTHSNLLALRNTRLANLFGLTAITLPTGLPGTGIMFFGAPNGEERLLRLAAAAESALA